MTKQKNLNYYKNLASRHARSARSSQMKHKSFKEGLDVGIRLSKEAAR